MSRLCNKNHLLHPQPLDSIKAPWEEDLGEVMSRDLWMDIVQLLHNFSICQGVFLHNAELFIDPKATLSRPVICGGRRLSSANLMHMFGFRQCK